LHPFGTIHHLQNITISSFAKYTLKFLKLPYEKPKEKTILTYGMLSEFLGHLHFCQHLESCRDPWPPQPKRREEEEEEEVAVMPNQAANVTYPPWLSNATTSRHNMPPLLKLPTTEKANLYYTKKKKKTQTSKTSPAMKEARATTRS
jgi:hypothetical protein